MAEKNEAGLYESISDQTLSQMKSFVSSGIFSIAIFMTGLEVSNTITSILTAVAIILAEVYCFTFVATMVRGYWWSLADQLNVVSTLLAIIVTASVYLKHYAQVPGFDYPTLTVLLATGMFLSALVEKVLRGIGGAPVADIAVKSGSSVELYEL